MTEQQRIKMHLLHLLFLQYCLGRAMGSGKVNLTSTHKSSREGKVFSLFSIVQFKNEGCRSNQAISGSLNGFLNGTCYASSECSANNGRAAGSCAAGFGVCCLFIVSATGGTVSQNCSYIQNPGFPNGVTTSTAALTYTIIRQDNSVCQIRLDFERLILNPLASSATICGDKLTTILSNGGPTIPVICGTNTDQHMYLDIGSRNSNTATLTFSFDATFPTTMRSWDIKVTQIPCGSTGAPPDDCLQYRVGLTGRFTTFNFMTDGTGKLLPNQHYSACIRQEEGFCCIQFEECNNPVTGTNSFSLLPTAATTNAQHDVMCRTNTATVAYIGIPGSSGSCIPGTNTGLTSAYCGTALSTVKDATVAMAMAICDCTPPFRLEVFSSSVLTALAPTPITVPTYSLGACLTWMQLPCN